MSYQMILVVGNLGKDPEMRYAPSGDPVTNFSVAVNREYTKNEEKIKEVTWFRISVWGKQAEACNQYLKKGSQVLVEGRITSDPDTGGPRIYPAQDGTARTSFEITANTVRFLSSSKEGSGSGIPVSTGNAPQAKSQDQEFEETFDESDIPF